MTLALYGKSKKRQGSLLLAALLAILVATIGGLSVITSAFAHNTNNFASLKCNGDWSSRLWYENGGSGSGDLRLVLIRDVKVNNVAYDVNWASGVGDGTSDGKQTNGLIVTRASYNDANETGLPAASGTEYIWVGVDDTFDIFNRNQGSPVAAAFNSAASAWAGEARVYAWVDPPGGGTNFQWVDQNFTKPVLKPTLSEACLHIKKVVTGTGADAAQNFTAKIENLGGSSGEHLSGVSFSQGPGGAGAYSQAWEENGDDFEISEINLPTGYAVVAKKILTGYDQSCDSTAASWVTTSPGLAKDGILDSVNNGDAITVCFKNEYTAPGELTVTKVATGGVTTTTDPAAVKWDITFYNSTDDYRTIGITDANVTVVGAPAFTDNNTDVLFGDPNCSGISNGGTLSPEKECNLPHDTGVKITVKPTTLPVRTCQDQTFANQVSWRQHTWNFLTPNAWSASTNTPAQAVAIVLQGDPALCAGNLSISKGAASKVNATIQWTVTLTNSGGTTLPAYVYDPGTTLVSYTGCTADPTEPQTDVYFCNVPAADATLVLSKPYSRPDLCLPFHAENSAILLKASPTHAAPYSAGEIAQTAVGGAYHEDAVASASCITVQKSDGVVAADTTKIEWTITFTNSGPQATVDMSDTYEDPNLDGNADTHLSSYPAGCAPVNLDEVEDCEVIVAAGTTTVVKVYTARPAAQCESQTVTNTVAAVLGITLLATTPNGTGYSGTYTEPANSDLCDVTIRICKVWRTSPGENDISLDPMDFDFMVGSAEVTIGGVEEGDLTPTCEDVTVKRADLENGLAISEDPLTGFLTPTNQINDGSEVSGASLDLFWDGEVCSRFSQESLVAGLISELFASVFNFVELPVTAKIACTVTFYNDDTSNVLPTGSLRIEKYLDINGDGDANDAGEGPISGWNMTVSGLDINGVFPTVGGVVQFDGLEPGEIYSVTEETRTGYTVTRATVNAASFGPVANVNATIPDGGTVIVRFYNQPKGTINVHKNTWFRVNNINSAAPDDDDNWTITVTSAACKINLSTVTDAAGNASFANLPLCTDYVVSENTTNSQSLGFTPASATSFSNVTPGFGSPVTITFNNEKVSTPCTGCDRVIQTPTTPASTPTTKPNDPTATPTPKKDDPKEPDAPKTAIQGEKTPGPGSPTPIAPSTGAGILGGTAGGFNILLILAGLLALTSGLSFMALGRKNRR